VKPGLLLRLFILGLALAPAARAQPVPSTDSIEGPSLDFTATPAIEGDYDKYFFYHRDDTDFATALADIRECDAYARGISLRLDGAMSGALAGGLTDAIFGAAARRDISRRNRRVCMAFKEYRRYGLPRSIWDQLNPEAGSEGNEDSARQRRFRIQARAASGPRPRAGAMDR
jgi:hypothetical protein